MKFKQMRVVKREEERKREAAIKQVASTIRRLSSGGIARSDGYRRNNKGASNGLP